MFFVWGRADFAYLAVDVAFTCEMAQSENPLHRWRVCEVADLPKFRALWDDGGWISADSLISPSRSL
jgi:hypothetical protein